MAEDLRRMQDLGFNTVYVTHNNDTIADPDGIEPGLAPPVWYALRNGTRFYDNSATILDSIISLLDASVEVGIDVVLPLGYQIQMGEEWNDANRTELRRDRNGLTLNHWKSGETASPYSEVYRRDILEYYSWVNDAILVRYPNIVAINLADEPMGADLSAPARAAFEARYGRPYDQSPARDRGEFLTGVIADYATWSAERWRELNPEMWTMMTFHIQRDAPFLPDIERIFADTPDTFIISADTHLDDGSFDRPITDANTNLLYGMVRTLGWLSNVYDHPLMLWTSANAWGLKRTGGVSEALQNLDVVHDVPKQVGGRLGMIMAWGWNIHGQGVYDDLGRFGAEKESFIADVSSALAQKRDRLSRPTPGQPDRCVPVPLDDIHRAIGEEQFTHLAEGLFDLRRFDFRGQNTIYLRDGKALEAARQAGASIG
jgi:hypothetical protein